MTVDSARGWVIAASLISTCGLFAFLLLAPLFGYPLDNSRGESARLLEIVIPVFVGYLGSASHFIFGAKNTGTTTPLPPNAKLLIQGSIYVGLLMFVVAFTGFGISNSMPAAQGQGWTLEFLAGSITAILAFMAATTAVAITYLFKQEKQESPTDPANRPTP